MDDDKRDHYPRRGESGQSIYPTHGRILSNKAIRRRQQRDARRAEKEDRLTPQERYPNRNIRVFVNQDGLETIVDYDTLQVLEEPRKPRQYVRKRRRSR
jgi:hypothetical protein